MIGPPGGALKGLLAETETYQHAFPGSDLLQEIFLPFPEEVGRPPLSPPSL